MDKPIEYNGRLFYPNGKRIGQDFQLCYDPRIAGSVIAYNAPEQLWLVALTIPYGDKKPVLMPVSEALMIADETVFPRADVDVRDEDLGGSK